MSKGRSTPKSGRGKRTREAILAAAVSVFSRSGVRQTSMLAIAQEAGIASGTVYQYFSDKEDIFRSLLGELDEQLRRATQLSVGGDGRLMAREAVDRYLAIHRENVAIQRAWWDLLEPRTEFTDAWLELHTRIRDEVSKAARSGQKEGLVSKKLDPSTTGDLVAMLFERPAYSRNILGWDEELTDDEVSDLIGRLLGKGLLDTQAGAKGPPQAAR